MAQITVLTEQHKASLKDLAAFIRIGAAIRPQNFGTLYGRRDGVVCSCVLGAAWEGMNPTFTAERWLSDAEFRKENKFDIARECDLEGVFVSNPLRPERASWFITIIVYLNDDQKWTREMIADWLEQLAS